jgi:hypothetical protein
LTGDAVDFFTASMMLLSLSWHDALLLQNYCAETFQRVQDMSLFPLDDDVKKIRVFFFAAPSLKLLW